MRQQESKAPSAYLLGGGGLFILNGCSLDGGSITLKDGGARINLASPYSSSCSDYSPHAGREGQTFIFDALRNSLAMSW